MTDLRHTAAVVRMCLAEAGHPDAEVTATATGIDIDAEVDDRLAARAIALAHLGVELGRTGYRP